jgi:hypothetical protein
MIRRLIILNLGLLTLLALGGVKIRRDWKAFGPAHDVSQIQPKPQTFPPLAAGGASGSTDADWTEIPSKDPFSFDRNDVDIVVAEAPPKPIGPKPFLAGTVIIGKDRWALVAPPLGRNTLPAKVGQTVGDWTIVEILEKSIEIESNGTRQSVIINDPTANVPRADGRTQAGGTVSQATQAPAPQNTTTPSTPAQPNQTQPNGQKCNGRLEQTAFGITRCVQDPPSKP